MRFLCLIASLSCSPLFVSAHPGLGKVLQKRVVSPDNSCGGIKGYTCPSSLPCCSKYNWCGSTDAYCKAGCQASFGTCSGGNSISSSQTTTSTTASPTSTTASSTSNQPSGVVSPDNSCGGTNGYICPKSLPCCSKYGWCGSTYDYCGVDCKPAFGTCLGVSPDNTCGGKNGYTCPQTLPCCSRYGFCGSSSDYCGNGCQPAFGTCGGTATSTSTSTTSAASPTGTGTANIPRPKIGNVPYGTFILDCVTKGDIAITFDDGPYLYTNDLLDLLARYGVKATFFIVGNNGNGAIDQIPQWTYVVQRMDREGHHIASHTWDHADLTTLTSAQRKDEMYKNEQAFANILGKFPTYMRPPYLAFNSNPGVGTDMANLGYHVISTNLDTKDYANDDPNLIQTSKNTFNSYVSSNSPSSSSFIVLNHDVHYQTVYNLTEYELQRVAATGYRPVTVGECLGDPSANWYRAAPAVAAKAQGFAAPLGSFPPQSQSLQPPSNVCTYVFGTSLAGSGPVSNSTGRVVPRFNLPGRARISNPDY